MVFSFNCMELINSCSTTWYHVNQSWLTRTSRPRQNNHHFPDDIFKCIFLNENLWISIKCSLRVPKGPTNNIPALVQKMAWHRVGDKPLSEPKVTQLNNNNTRGLADSANNSKRNWLFVQTSFISLCNVVHDDVIKWKHFPRYWPFVRGIHRSPVNSPHKGQWRGAQMHTSQICAWTPVIWDTIAPIITSL